MDAQQPAPPMQGPLVMGGSGYRLHELSAPDAGPTFSTGFDVLDHPAGIAPGAVWTLAAPAGLGASDLALQVAVAAARTGRVRLSNGHIPTHLLRDRVLTAARHHGLDEEALARLELASSTRLPPPDVHMPKWEAGALDLLVLDTVDEMWDDPYWPETAEARLRHLRWIRTHARETNTALLLTARIDPPCTDGFAAFEERWDRHWARAVFADISDVRLEMWQETTPFTITKILKHTRGLPTIRATGSPSSARGWLLRVSRE